MIKKTSYTLEFWAWWGHKDEIDIEEPIENFSREFDSLKDAKLTINGQDCIMWNTDDYITISFKRDPKIINEQGQVISECKITDYKDYEFDWIDVKAKLNFNELMALGFSLLYCNSRGISNETKDKIQNQAVSILWKECHHSLGFEFKGGDDFPKEADDLYNKLLKSLGSKWGIYDSWEETDQALVSLIEGVKDGIKSDQLKLNYFTNLFLNNYLSSSNDGESFYNEIMDDEFSKRFSIINTINNAFGDDLIYQEMYKIIIERYGDHKITEQFQILSSDEGKGAKVD